MIKESGIRFLFNNIFVYIYEIKIIIIVNVQTNIN